MQAHVVMENRDLINRLRQFDAYPKTLEDFRIKTYAGAIGEYLKLLTELLVTKH